MHRLFALTVASALFAAPSGATEAQRPRSAAAGAAALADSTTAFACDLFRVLAASDGNLVLSPHSIASALAMARMGAIGETARQMDAVLHLPADAAALHRELARALADVDTLQTYGPDRKLHPVPEYSLAIANGLFVQRGWSFQPAFRQTVAADIGAELDELDFKRSEEARATINRWVAGKTKDRIQDICPPGVLSSLTRMVLCNAIHFKAAWEHPFPDGETKDAPFFVTPERQVSAPRMRTTFLGLYAETADARAVELPYTEGGTTMLVVLPKSKDGLGALVGKLSTTKLDAWIDGRKKRQIALELPRFKFTPAIRLRETLQQLGMKAAFDQEKADFTGMAAERPLFIGDVLHKAFVAVDEKGTEAAAATMVEMTASAIQVPSPDEVVPFVVDHPFLFLIRHAGTGTILFLGRVVDPTAT